MFARRLKDHLTDASIHAVLARVGIVASRGRDARRRDLDPHRNHRAGRTIAGRVASGVLAPVFERVQNLKAGEALILDWPGGCGEHRLEAWAASGIGEMLADTGVTAMSFYLTINVPDRMVETRKAFGYERAGRTGIAAHARSQRTARRILFHRWRAKAPKHSRRSCREARNQARAENAEGQGRVCCPSPAPRHGDAGLGDPRSSAACSKTPFPGFPRQGLRQLRRGLVSRSAGGAPSGAAISLGVTGRLERALRQIEGQKRPRLEAAAPAYFMRSSKRRCYPHLAITLLVAAFTGGCFSMPSSAETEYLLRRLSGGRAGRTLTMLLFWQAELA